MPKTANDIARLALRELEVLGLGQDMSADDFDHANEHLELLYAELTEPPRSIPIDWALTAVPEKLAAGLAQTLATRIGRTYGKAFSRQTSEEAMDLLIGQLLPDDRVDNVSENTRKRAAFY